MSEQDSSHLTPQQMSQYAAGDCEDDAVAYMLEVHLAQCEACAAQVRTARLVGRTLDDMIAFAEGSEVPAEAHVQYPSDRFQNNI